MIYMNVKSISDIKKHVADYNKRSSQINTSSMHPQNGRLSLNKFDKSGTMQYLHKLSFSKLSKSASKASLNALSHSQYSQGMGRDTKYTPGEMRREIHKAIITLRSKKLSEINNYNQTDNVVLQRQIQAIKNLSSSEFPVIRKKH